MRLPSRHHERTRLQFNITPLIDVVFLLIIFFLVASHFVRSEQAKPVDLPLASAGTSEHDLVQYRLTVTIDRDGHYFVGGEPQPEPVVKSRIEGLQVAAAKAGVEPEVRLRSHKDGRYGPMKAIVEHCAAHNIRSIQFAVAVGDER